MVTGRAAAWMAWTAPHNPQHLGTHVQGAMLQNNVFKPELELAALTLPCSMWLWVRTGPCGPWVRIPRLSTAGWACPPGPWRRYRWIGPEVAVIHTAPVGPHG